MFEKYISDPRGYKDLQKRTKEDAEYFEQEEDDYEESCVGCAYYRDSECKIVQGEVTENGICKYWENREGIEQVNE